MNYDLLIEKIKEFVEDAFKSTPDEPLVLQVWDDTVRVVARVKEIGVFNRLKAEDLFALEVAAWFHDIGFCFGGEEDHEETGVVIMESFMEMVASDRGLVPVIRSCIRSTKEPYTPVTLLETILCDAIAGREGLE